MRPKGTRLLIALLVPSLISIQPLLIWAQDRGLPYVVGIVYYADRGAFKAFDKEGVLQSGRGTYSGKVKGAHATVRLQADQPQIFRVCGVDPTRYKLFRFKSEGNTRGLIISKNTLIGGYKVVLSESEIPVKIQTAESGCFTIAPQETLRDGEFGFSPVESLDAFMFGVGDVKQSR